MPFSSRDYRRQLGFKSKKELKKHFKGTDIVSVNWDRIEQFNQRLKEIFFEINQTVHRDIQLPCMDEINTEIDNAYIIMRENGVFLRLNNYGRYPEDLYYSWMRGYIACKYFTPALAKIFDVPERLIRTVGHDNLTDIATFSKSPVADLEITIDDITIRLEIQSGYTGINDIKAHKVREAKRAYYNDGILSYVVHFDLFNGAMAIVDITNIKEDSIHWDIRTQMEGQRVFSIPEEAFRWYISNELPYYLDILY